ncbi:MAG: ankyrin repeat domain-containing protein, partial [Betaproteobacteria bacterium]|nr:ankyrin repeat domain-containing protein [Betaproteobacteria bacterium]
MKKFILLILTAALPAQLSFADDGDVGHTLKYASHSFHHMAFHGNLAKVKQFVAAKRDINEKREYGFSVLHDAASGGN